MNSAFKRILEKSKTVSFYTTLADEFFESRIKVAVEKKGKKKVLGMT